MISASRRTDIPSFFGAWFMHRVRAGFCLVANPFRPSQVTRVDLRPVAVDAIVFWTKDPGPFMDRLADLDAQGYRYYFLFTLNPYGPPLEPGLSSLDRRVAVFRELGRRLGAGRVVWRYDPVVLSARYTPAYHQAAFADLAARLAGATQRVIVSFVDMYRKTRRRLAAVAQASGDTFADDPLAHPQAPDLVAGLAAMARDHGLEIQACGEDDRLAAWGIPAGPCIDAGLVSALGAPGRAAPRHRGQRPLCHCAYALDIGVPDTCCHDCAYCYATASPAAARRRAALHDPAGAALLPLPAGP